MPNEIREINYLIEKKHYDIIIVGGGVAGVAAALSARRNGASVLLLEKGISLGGLATMGLVIFYLPALDDNKGRKLIGGIAEELLHLSIKYGYNTLDPAWKPGIITAKTKNRYKTMFSPGAFIAALDEILAKEGIDILFDTLFSKTVMHDDLCEGIIVETKAGREYYTAGMVVDTTGDADVMLRSGAPCVEDDNFLTFWTVSTSLELMKKAVESGDIREALKVDGFGANADGIGHPDWAKKYRITGGAEEVTDFILKGRGMFLDRLKTTNPNDYCPVTLPSMPQLRTTRRIQGLYELTRADRMVRFDDSIGCAAEEHHPEYIIEIPYRTLVTRETRNIITAGRSISSSGRVRELTRLIAISALTGEAAGAACAVALEKNTHIADIPIDILQKKLMKTGNTLHY